MYMNYDLTCKVLRCTVLSLCINKAVDSSPSLAVSEDTNIIIISSEKFQSLEIFILCYNFVFHVFEGKNPPEKDSLV